VEYLWLIRVLPDERPLSFTLISNFYFFDHLFSFLSLSLLLMNPVSAPRVERRREKAFSSHNA
jgi:hypothetical protein